VWVGTVECVTTETVEMCERNRAKKTVTKRKNTTLEIYKIVMQIFAAGLAAIGHSKWAL